MERTPAAIADRFAIDAAFVDAWRYGNGHINDTFLGTYRIGTRTVRYIHQRINDRIFGDVPALMENIERVTAHLRRNEVDDEQTLALVPTRDGKSFTLDDDGGYWRTYDFIEGARTYEMIARPEQAYEAARAFGSFSRRLADLPGGLLHETIPHFHDTGRRFAIFLERLAADVCNRAATVKEEMRFAFDREGLVNMLARMPSRKRVTHNDTKLNNVMIDNASGRGVCVIDLDTVMCGSVFSDFGDMVRTATMPVAEDERDVSKVDVRIDMFDAVTRGFAEGIGDGLTVIEREHMVTAGSVMTFEAGLRFLTDYLDGDNYFKTSRPGQNLDRARSQFALVRSLELRHALLERCACAAFAG